LAKTSKLAGSAVALGGGAVALGGGAVALGGGEDDGREDGDGDADGAGDCAGDNEGSCDAGAGDCATVPAGGADRAMVGGAVGGDDEATAGADRVALPGYGSEAAARERWLPVPASRG
jgi:hypothetical protein